MSKKRYHAYIKQTEIYSVTFHDDAEDGSVDEGTLLALEYRDGKVYLVKVSWGAEEDWERSRDGEVEINWCFDEENIRKIMLRTGTHNVKDMMQAMYERFCKYRDTADHYIEKWCQEKEITYSYYVHY